MDESSSSRARESRPRRRVIDDPQTAHFITFGCDRRRQLLNQDRCKRIVIHKAWEKLNYMHQNPVQRDLAPTPEAWPFSSARWYSARKSVGVTLAHIDE